MGARWAWYARCEAGHIFSNFSGGSDGVCDAVEGCNAAVDCEIQCPHMFDEEPCDCEKYLESRMDKRPVDPCHDCTALRTRLAEVEGKRKTEWQAERNMHLITIEQRDAAYASRDRLARRVEEVEGALALLLSDVMTGRLTKRKRRLRAVPPDVIAAASTALGERSRDGG